MRVLRRYPLIRQAWFAPLILGSLLLSACAAPQPAALPSTSAPAPTIAQAAVAPTTAPALPAGATAAVTSTAAIALGAAHACYDTDRLHFRDGADDAD